MSIDIPNYQILGKLGKGAGSALLLARSTRTGAKYTVKVVKVHEPEDMKFVDQLRNEHSVGSTVDHPVVRRTYELRYVRRRLTKIKSAMLFMEYVDGVPLNDPDFSCPLPELLTYFSKAAEGLQGMHRAGFVHADLKPGNILVTPDGRVKLIDLGQACEMGEVKSKVQGTPDYIAPEQVSLGALDARTDVFGMGATLYKVLTGKAMPTDMNQRVCLQRMSLIGRRAAELDQPLDGELAGPLDRLIEACCQKEPAKRLPNMKALMDRLELTRGVLLKRQAATVRWLGSSSRNPPLS
ncbi:MAG TPA: serine/threonine-protein kinase [Phycisphaerae bacterium]|nr:serine/threonine-protein kinase [Phycisphaerae bacterium]